MMLGNKLLIPIPDIKVFWLIKTIYYQNAGLIDYKNKKWTSKGEDWQYKEVGEKKNLEIGQKWALSLEAIENIIWLFIALIYT